MFSMVKKNILVIDRRDLMRGGMAASAAALLPTSIALAKGEEPTGHVGEVTLDGAGAVDVNGLEPGDMVILKTEGSFVGILRRTLSQQSSVAAGGSEMDETLDADRVQDVEWLVTDLKCPHRGCQVSYLSDEANPFQCPCHKSIFDAAGRLVSGKSKTSLEIPKYTIESGVVTFL